MKSRMERERETVGLMINHFCRERHSPQGDLCPECQALREYAEKRLSHCPFQEGKTTCGNCPVHCYRPDRRAQIREVMRSVGPRMLLLHPLAGIMHLIDGLRKKPIRKKTDPKARGRDD